MKINKSTIAVVALCLVLAIMVGGMLLIYVRPMDKAYVDLYMGFREEGVVTRPEEYDDKGWTVFTQEGDLKTELTPDGHGCYTGLDLGQTFYYSRVMTEKADNPTVQIEPGESRFAVWLDNEQLYADIDGLDNRIGHVHLPMYRGGNRIKPIVIRLPQDYQGKTLTIAQSSPDFSETGTVGAYPTDVTFYCDYAEESELISETYQTAMVTGIAFCVFLVLLLRFVRDRNPGVLCLALITAFWMLKILINTEFFGWYNNGNYDLLRQIVPWLITLILLVFLALRGGKYRWIQWGVTGLYGLILIGFVVTRIIIPVAPASNHIAVFFTLAAPGWFGLIALLTALVLGAVFWRKNDWFYRVFIPIALVGIVISVFYAYRITYRAVFWDQFKLQFYVIGRFFYSLVQPPIMIAMLITVFAEFIRGKWKHWTGKREMAPAPQSAPCTESGEVEEPHS